MARARATRQSTSISIRMQQHAYARRGGVLDTFAGDLMSSLLEDESGVHGDELLALAEGKPWALQQLGDGRIGAQFFGMDEEGGGASGEILMMFAPSHFPALGGPSVGQWCFIPNKQTDTYTLGWYLCATLDDPNQHFFVLVSATKLVEQCRDSPESVYQLSNTIAKASLDKTRLISEQACYRSPQVTEVLDLVQQANLVHVQQQHALWAQLQQEMHRATRRAGEGETGDELRRKLPAAGVPRDLLEDAILKGGPRKFVQARRVFTNHPGVRGSMRNGLANVQVAHLLDTGLEEDVGGSASEPTAYNAFPIGGGYRSNRHVRGNAEQAPLDENGRPRPPPELSLQVQNSQQVYPDGRPWYD